MFLLILRKLLYNEKAHYSIAENDFQPPRNALQLLYCPLSSCSHARDWFRKPNASSQLFRIRLLIYVYGKITFWNYSAGRISHNCQGAEVVYSASVLAPSKYLISKRNKSGGPVFGIKSPARMQLGRGAVLLPFARGSNSFRSKQVPDITGRAEHEATF